MRLSSVRDLKQQLLERLIMPFTAAAAPKPAAPRGVRPVEPLAVAARPFNELSPVQRSVALGIATQGSHYRLAVRVQRPALLKSPLVEHIVKEARGEADVRLIGRIDKRARRTLARALQRAPVPWYRTNIRPLQIGTSVGHVSVTAGTLGAFVKRNGRTYILSNNHVLANEDKGKKGDAILQRARYDGGRAPRDRVASLQFWVRLKRTGANLVDAALAELDAKIAFDPTRLRDLVGGANRKLAGLGPGFLDEGTTVYKIGRTTGPTEGRVTAFDVDNVVVGYDMGNLRFDGQVEIEGAGQHAFSDGGDSGSLIVDASFKAVALLFAGGDSGGSNGLGLTYANSIHEALKQLKATLAT